MAAAAKAAVRALLLDTFEPDQTLWIPDREEPMVVPVVSSERLDAGRSALAISHCDPGEGLDLTRGLEIWVTACWRDTAEPPVELLGGAGIGRYAAGGQLCVSAFARQLLQSNLEPLLPAGRGVALEVVLPRGRELAERTSNAAFGVVDGLALIGVQAEVQRSAAPDQLDQVLDQVKRTVDQDDFAGQLTLVIGENGLDLARQAGLEPRIKVGNWMGPVLVAAAEAGVQDLLLLGYHGKLVKLAGGIFHTHHHLADGRQEVLIALGLDAGLTRLQLEQLRSAASVDGAMNALEAQDPAAASRLWDRLAAAVEQRSAAYVARYGRWSIRIGVALFDRSRQLRRWGPTAAERFFTLKD